MRLCVCPATAFGTQAGRCSWPRSGTTAEREPRQEAREELSVCDALRLGVARAVLYTADAQKEVAYCYLY